MIPHTLSGRTVLITGATGFLGGALASWLAARGVHVRALVRTLAKAEALRRLPPEQITLIPGALDDEAALRDAVAGCDFVFHCAALLGGSIERQRAVNVSGTHRLASAAADAGVRRFIHVSTLSVYGVCYDGLITEAHAPAPGSDPYGISKAEAEGIVREVCAERALSYAILRPGMIYGPGAGLWTRGLFRLASRVPTPWIGAGGGLAHCVYVDDVLEMMALLAEHPAAEGEAFNCSSDPSPSWRAFLGEYMRLARGVNDDWLELAPEIFYVVGGLAMLFSPPYSRGRMLCDYASFVQKRAQFSMRKARERLGWEPRIGVEEGVARCADWLRSEGLLTKVVS